MGCFEYLPAPLRHVATAHRIPTEAPQQVSGLHVWTAMSGSGAQPLNGRWLPRSRRTATRRSWTSLRARCRGNGRWAMTGVLGGCPLCTAGWRRWGWGWGCRWRRRARARSSSSRTPGSTCTAPSRWSPTSAASPPSVSGLPVLQCPVYDRFRHVRGSFTAPPRHLCTLMQRHDTLHVDTSPWAPSTDRHRLGVHALLWNAAGWPRWRRPRAEQGRR